MRIFLSKESSGPLNDAKGAINYGFERVVLRILPSDARRDVPQPPVVPREKVTAAQTDMDVDESPSDDSAFNLERLFEEVDVDSLASAELALLEKSLKIGNGTD